MKSDWTMIADYAQYIWVVVSYFSVIFRVILVLLGWVEGYSTGPSEVPTLSRVNLSDPQVICAIRAQVSLRDPSIPISGIPSSQLMFGWLVLSDLRGLYVKTLQGGALPVIKLVYKTR